MDFEEFAERERLERRIRGLAVGVARRGEPLIAKGFGGARPDEDARIGASTRFQIASLSKPFLAIVVLQLVEDGLISLEDRLVDLVPGLPGAWTAVRVEHILRHRSGLPSYTRVAQYWERTAEDKDPQQIVDMVAALPLGFEPGSRWAYDNTGFYLLWLLVQEVTGLEYDRVLQERVCGVLGMSDTSVHDPRNPGEEHAIGTEVVDDVIRPAPYYSASNAPYNLSSSLSDLGKWDVGLHSGALLPERLQREMWRRDVSPAGNEKARGLAMGLAWFLFETSRGRMATHEGETPAGFCSSVHRLLDENLSVIVLCNCSRQAAFYEIPFGIAQSLLPDLKIIES